MINWKEQEVPDFEGLFISEKEAYPFENGQFISKCNPTIDYFQDVTVLCTYDIPNTNYRICGGEASGHGSIGVIVLENTESGEAIWSLLSSDSNPFKEISTANELYQVKSTTGSVFSFELPNKKIELKIHNQRLH